ncbi:hypothetical protein [Laceyella putida]|uniref:Chromosome partition protein Smc n=1 Tax=Laceyella putida TaxID=110101 RepID=A0ABW2RFD4_9BACL
MGLFDRFSSKEEIGKSGELQEIYEELIHLYNKLEVWEGELAQLRKADQQLQEAAAVRQSAMMVSEKLSEVYRDVQLISEAIRKDDRETRRFVVQHVGKMESTARNALAEAREAIASEIASFKGDLSQLVDQTHRELKKRMEDEWQELICRLEEKQSQHDSAIQALQDQLNEWQKKNEQMVTGLNAEFMQKEERWKSQLKQRDRLLIIAMLVSIALSAWSLLT